MIGLLLVAAALAPTPAPSYTGRTTEDRRVTLTVRDGRVTRVRTTVAVYRCARFGDIGPLAISLAARARVDRRGRFAFVTGERAERVAIAGRLRGRDVVTGRIRVSGTIGTGERCSSRTVRFRATAR
jgi:hypothetical protein